jgi:hypothetical protein
MSLFKKIAKSIDASVADFCEAIATRFDIDKTELLEMWTKTNGGSGAKKTKKRSAYVSFSVQIRPVVIQENPDLKFGDISREISARWKALSAEEKAKYASTDDHDAPDAAPKAPPKTKKGPIAAPNTKKAIPDDSPQNYSKMKIKELRDLCKEKGLKTSGNKMELIERLVGPVEDNVEDHDDDEESGVGTPESILSLEEVEEIDGVEDIEETEEENDETLKMSPVAAASPIVAGDTQANISDSESTPSTPESLASSPPKAEDKYDDMKIGELRDLCKTKGINSKGNKQELIARLCQ